MRTVQEIMSIDMVTVNNRETINETAVKMKQNDIGIIPVVDGERLLGVITDRDLVLRGYAENKMGSEPIESLFTKNVSTVTPDTLVDEAAQLMASEKIRRLPVVDNGRLVGIIAIADIATKESFNDAAGRALSDISENVDHQSAGMH